jgi:UDP-N-acetylmuramoyl-tripeptide--D-alanyl-D-alanine ligase
VFYTFSMSKFTNLSQKLSKEILNKFYKQNPTLKMIAIFGSVGKSSTTYLVAKLLKNANYNVLTTKKNTINGMGMMLIGKNYGFEGAVGFLNKIKFIRDLFWFKTFGNYNLPAQSILVLEIGFDYQNEAMTFDQVLENRLDIGIVTALTDEHNANYSSTNLNSQYIESLNFDLSATKHLPIDTQNVILEMLYPLLHAKQTIVPTDYGILSNSLLVNKNKLESSLHGISIGDKYLLPDTFTKTFEIAYQVALMLNINPEIIQTTFLNFNLPPSRFSKLQGIKNTTIIDSSYNSDPDSVLGFLASLKKELAKNTLNHNLVLGEMRELGQIATQKHQEILDQVIILQNSYQGILEHVCLVGQEWLKLDIDNTKKHDGYINYIVYKGQSFKVFLQSGRVFDYLEPNLRPNSWVWIKGSQNTIFLEILVEQLLANKDDIKLVCRQEPRWFNLRKPYL